MIHFSTTYLAVMYKMFVKNINAPNYVADVMNEEGFQTEKHDIDDVFKYRIYLFN